MIDFKIFRASSEELFPNGELNHRLIIEEGCWYLCTDTAELFVGTRTETGLTLKRINESEIHHIPVDDLALKSDLESVKQEVIETVVPEVESVKTAVQEVLLPKVEEEIVPVIEEVKSTTEELKAWVDNKEFLQHIDLEGYATEDYVKQAITEAELAGKDVDLTDYVTKDEIAGLASESYVDEKVAEIKVPTKVSELENDAGYLTEHQSLEDYAKKADLDGLATETFVTEAIGGIKLPESELYKVDFNAPDFEKAVEAYNSGKMLVLINAAPDVNSYAVMNYVSTTYITFTKFLMSRSETYGAFNAYYLKSDNTWEVAKEVKLNKVEANVEGEAKSELTSIRIGKEIYSLPSAVAVTNIIEQIQNIEQNYVTNDKVNEIITEEVTTKVEEHVETKVVEVIQDKVDTGEITVSTGSIAYGDF